MNPNQDQKVWVVTRNRPRNVAVFRDRVQACQFALDMASSDPSLSFIHKKVAAGVDMSSVPATGDKAVAVRICVDCTKVEK